MKKYIDFIASLPDTPGFKASLPALLLVQVLIGISNAAPSLFVITIVLTLIYGGFWVEYLSNSIRCEEFAFPRFQNNIGNFISLGFRFGFVNIVYVLPFIILTIVSGIFALVVLKSTLESGDIGMLVPKVVGCVAIAFLWLCIAFYIFPLIAMRFSVTKSVSKTFNIKRMYVLWRGSKDIYKKMFEDIVVISFIFFVIGIIIMLIPVVFVSGSIATIALSKESPLELFTSTFGSLGMGLVMVFVLYLAFSILSILSTFAIYKIIATYYKIPHKTAE